MVVLYRPTSETDAPSAVGRLIDQALASGWQPLRQGPTRLEAHKALPDGEDLFLDVYWYDKPDPETGAEIGVRLQLGVK